MIHACETQVAVKVLRTTLIPFVDFFQHVLRDWLFSVLILHTLTRHSLHNYIDLLERTGLEQGLFHLRTLAPSHPPN